MKKIINWFLNPPVTGQSAILILRLMTGSVFFWEGILKFVYVNQGVGRFTKLGFAFPETTAHFIAVGEIIGCSLLPSLLSGSPSLLPRHLIPSFISGPYCCSRVAPVLSFLRPSHLESDNSTISSNMAFPRGCK